MLYKYTNTLIYLMFLNGFFVKYIYLHCNCNAALVHVITSTTTSSCHLWLVRPENERWNTMRDN
jgi:hypothetical protein